MYECKMMYVCRLVLDKMMGQATAFRKQEPPTIMEGERQDRCTTAAMGDHYGHSTEHREEERRPQLRARLRVFPRRVHVLTPDVDGCPRLHELPDGVLLDLIEQHLRHATPEEQRPPRAHELLRTLVSVTATHGCQKS